MWFNLSSILRSLHQNLQELSEPLIRWLEEIPALQSLHPYRIYIPYLVAGLGVLLLLLSLRLMTRRSRGRKRKQTWAVSSPVPQALSSEPSKGPAIQGRAIDGMGSFGSFDSFSSPSDSRPEDDSAGSLRQPTPFRFAPSAELHPTPPQPDPAPTVVPPPEPAAAAATPASGPVLPPESEFQRIYIEMYIDQELTTNFSNLRSNVNDRLSKGAPTEPLLAAGDGSVEDRILAHIAHAALELLQNKDSHTDGGRLTLHGQELCKIYRYALSRLKKSGVVAGGAGEKLLQDVQEKIQRPG